VEGGLDLLADEGVDLLVGPDLRSRLDLAAAKAIESRLREGYVEGRRGNFDYRVGKQIIAWGRTDRLNPVERAPSLPISVELKEPDEEALARLASDPTIAREFDADHTWAEAVQKLNDGRHAEAETELLAFVAAYPRHSAADNALFLAGLVREVRGDCAGALQLFESVPLKYPAGDAVPQAQLERGRCLRILGRKDEAKSVLKQLAMEHPHASETAQSRQLLQDL